MSERIHKLQPNRTMSLRGFDGLGASAALHSATASSFQVSGNFRDAADFAVAILWDADNFYEHPRLKYLPDFNFNGLTLTFDLLYDSGLQQIDSPKYPSISWPYLECTLADATTAQPATVPLWDHASLVSGDFSPATGMFHFLAETGVQQNDRMSLWFENFSFDYTAPALNAAVEYQFFSAGTGTVHQITVNGRVYAHTESNPAGESSADQANALVALINAGSGDPQMVAAIGSVPSAVRLSVIPGQSGQGVAVTGTGNIDGVLSSNLLSDAVNEIARQINATDWWSVQPLYCLRASVGSDSILVAAGRYGTVDTSGTTVDWLSGTKFTGLIPGSTIVINQTIYTIATVASPLRLTLATSAGTQSGAGYVADRGGSDGNMIELYSLYNAGRTNPLRCQEASVRLSGGNSVVTWRIALDFHALGLDRLRQCALTFAPALANSRAYLPSEWQASFTNWTVSGPESVTMLQVAGLNSVRVEDTDTACTYAGLWASVTPATGFFSGGIAHAAGYVDATRTTLLTATSNETVQVTYSCGLVHDLYVGTSLWFDRGSALVSLDRDSETELNCKIPGSASDSFINTRRLVRSSVAAGTHQVKIRMKTPGAFYFDFVEAVVASDIPAAPPSRDSISPALDYSTDHSYKLPPARVMWVMDSLGLTGPVNEYIGVFWYNQRINTTAVFPSVTVQFGGAWTAGDVATLTFGQSSTAVGTPLSKSVFAADTVSSIAAHFARYINELFVSIWASWSGGVLTITSRSPDYSLTFSTSKTSNTGTMTVSGSLQGGLAGAWVVDPAQTPALNRGARDWHADLFLECSNRGREVVTSGSMELVNPPTGFAALFADGLPAATDVGFSSLTSTHCAQSSAMRAYQASVFDCVTDLQHAAGLVPNIQFGEYVWWYFPHVTTNLGMAYFDAETTAAALAALGRPLHAFTGPDDDPTVNGSADAIFLRNRLRDHVAALRAHVKARYPTAQCEVLYPVDVNYPTPQGGIGGRLNHFINFPVEWGTKTGAGFDRLKIEALAFGGYQKNLDLALSAIQFPFSYQWPVDSLRYLAPVFVQSTAWQKEVQMAVGMRYPVVNLWAFDQVNIFGLDVLDSPNQARSSVFGM
jgi:hypothetical protein